MKRKIMAFIGAAVIALLLASCGNDKVSVELTAVGDTPIALVKAVREITNLDLKDAKSIVDNVPSVVIKDVSRQEAEEIKEKLENASGTAVIK